MSYLSKGLLRRLQILLITVISMGAGIPANSAEKGARKPLFSFFGKKDKAPQAQDEVETIKVKREGVLGFLGFKKEVPAPQQTELQAEIEAPTPTPEAVPPKAIPVEEIAIPKAIPVELPTSKAVTPISTEIPTRTAVPVLRKETPTTAPRATIVSEDELPRGLNLAQENPLTEAEKAEIERLVLNAKKAIPVDQEDTKIIEELAVQEGVGKIDFEPEDENQTLSNEQLALIGAGGIATSILLATSLQQLIKWYDQKIEEYHKNNNRGKITGELEKLKSNLSYLRSQYSWIENRLAQMGLTIRSSAAGDRLRIAYKKVTGQKLAAAQLEIEKSQKDLAFRLREIAQQRTELVYSIGQKLLRNSNQELNDFNTIQKGGALEEKNLTQEQKRERGALNHTLETARDERAKSEERIQQAEKLLPKITPYLNGGEKPSPKEIDLYLGFGNVDDNEKRIWAELKGHEKTLGQKKGALKRQEIALAALNAVENKIPSPEGSIKKRLLIQAQQKAQTLQSEIEAIQHSIEISKSKLKAYGPTNRLQGTIKSEKEKSADRLTEINKLAAQIEEITPQQENARRALAETRTQRENEAADKAREKIADFGNSPVDHALSDEQAALRRLDERENRLIQEAQQREQETESRVSDLSESAHIKAQEDAARELATFLDRSLVSADSNSLVLESKPEFTASLTDPEGSEVSEAVDFLISQLVEEKRAEISPFVQEAIKTQDASKLQELIKSDEKNALVISELLAEKRTDLKSQKVSYLPLTLENKEKAFISSTLKSIKPATLTADKNFRAKIQNGPERRIAPSSYSDSHITVALSRTAAEHPIAPDLIQNALRTGQLGAEIHQLLREDPLRAASVIKQIPLNNLLTGGAMGNNKKLLNELRQTPQYNVDKILEARLKNTRLSSQIRSEIWLIESLQAVLGIPLSSNEASLYEGTNTRERKSVIEALLKRINENPQENLKIQRFLQQTNATFNSYDGQLSSEDDAKLDILRKALKVVKAQSKAHEIARRKNQRRIAVESDSRTRELERKIQEARQSIANLEARHSVASDDHNKAIIESQISAHKSHLATLEKTLEGYTGDRMYSAEPGTHKKVEITPDQGPTRARGFRKLTGCRGSLSST
ncbi:MAG: hypothetical protein R3A80_10435 [Bdellovibrionota bacterium]